MKPVSSILAAVALAIAPMAVLAWPGEPAVAQARHHWMRGETLPAPVVQAGPNVAYAAQRLRRPPDGYGWFSVDGEFLLASLSSGLILEVVDN